jgi:hypothetical protein
MYILAEDILYDVDKDGNLKEGAMDRGRKAVGIFYDAATDLAATDMSSLKEEGIVTPLCDSEPTLV